MAEEITKGLVRKRLDWLGYPQNQDELVDGTIVYKEDSYSKGKNKDAYLRECFSKASKKMTEHMGTPDFVIVNKEKDIIIVIECKENVLFHQTHDNLETYREDIGGADIVSAYCINGVLHYALYVAHQYDVIAIAASGISEDNFRFSSFYIKKNGTLKDIILLEDGEYYDT